MDLPGALVPPAGEGLGSSPVSPQTNSQEDHYLHLLLVSVPLIQRRHWSEKAATRRQ